MAGRRRVNWQQVAERLAVAIPRERLHPAARQALDEAAQARPPWLLAVSGGSDSVALALLVWAHWPERRKGLVLAHFNHRLRGRESANDARFCAALAAGLDMDFAGEAWDDVPATVSEAVAREARQAFFGRLARTRRAGCLLTGHQRDDVAETMLMRLARGSGAAGLAAPRPVHAESGRVTRVRPLLDLSRVELTEALQTAGATWREDRSNQGDQFFRNRLRAEVVPDWVAAARRDAVSGAALSRQLLEEDDVALEQWLAELAPIAVDGRLNLRCLAGKPVALWRRALQRWLLLQDERGDLSRQGFTDLLAAARAGRTTRFSLGSNGFVRIRRGWLWFEPI